MISEKQDLTTEQIKAIISLYELNSIDNTDLVNVVCKIVRDSIKLRDKIKEKIPDEESRYFVPCLHAEDYCIVDTWFNTENDNKRLDNNLVFLSKSDASAYGKLLISLINSCDFENVVIGENKVSHPEKVKLDIGTMYYCPSILEPRLYITGCWSDDDTDFILLKRNLIHITKDKAVHHAKSLILFSSKFGNFLNNDILKTPNTKETI